MKAFVILFAAMVVALSLSGCGGKKETTVTSNATNTSTSRSTGITSSGTGGISPSPSGGTTPTPNPPPQPKNVTSPDIAFKAPTGFESKTVTIDANVTTVNVTVAIKVTEANACALLEDPQDAVDKTRPYISVWSSNNSSRAPFHVNLTKLDPAANTALATCTVGLILQNATVSNIVGNVTYLPSGVWTFEAHGIGTHVVAVATVQMRFA